MAFIKINPEGMLTVINNLDERADGIATERKKINEEKPLRSRANRSNII